MVVLQVTDHGKAILVKGDTRSVKDQLKEKRGSWNKGLVGWIFPGGKRVELIEMLKNIAGVTVQDHTRAGGTAAPEAPAVRQPEPKPADPNVAEVKSTKTAAATSAPKRAESNVAAGGGETEIVLDDYTRVRVDSFMGARGVDIRKFYRDRESSEFKPTPKGVRLSAAEWAALVAAFPKVSSAESVSEEQQMNIQGDLFVSLRDARVDIRKFYTDKTTGEQKPSKKGVSLTKGLWDNLKEAANEIGAAIQGQSSSSPSAKKARKERKESTEGSTAGGDATPSSEKLRKAIEKLLAGRDLQTVTPKIVRQELEVKFSLEQGSLDSRRDELKEMITECISR